ncbi:MAG: hypothetical protein AAFV07_19340, partial [Bacteroidota bacterium]
MQRTIYLLVLVLIVTACTSIPTPERLVLQPFDPDTSFPLSSHAADLGADGLWDNQGWKLDPSGSLSTWTGSGAIARTSANHRDLELYLEVKLAPGSQLSIKFQDAYSLM